MPEITFTLDMEVVGEWVQFILDVMQTPLAIFLGIAIGSFVLFRIRAFF